MNSATGQPISGALVIMRAQPQLRPGESFRQPDPQRTVTDSSGRFSFEAENLISASLQASRQGYRSEENNSPTATTLWAPDFDTATLRLVPQSVVKGRILNSDGDPLYGLTVEAVRIDIVDGRREVKDNFANKVTDDRGEYRLWNLQPGSYYIKVAGRIATYNNSANTIFELSQDAYGPMYYPTATTQDTAQILRVEPGQTVNANFTLEARNAYQIRGKVSNLPPGRPLLVRLLRGVDVLGNRANVNRDAGTFQVADVTPGSYILQVYTANGSPPWMAEVPVNVGERDLTGVELVMAAGVDVHGKYEFAGDPEGFPLLNAHRVDSIVLPGTSAEMMAMMEPDQTGFSFKALPPGKYEISVSGGSGAHYVSSILAGTTDVLQEGLTVTAGGAPELTVTLAPGAGMLAGMIEGGAGTAQSRDTGQRWTLLLVGRRGLEATYRTEITFGDEFGVSSLAPGDYALYAWPARHPLEFRNSAVLASLSQYAASVKVGSGETKEVTLKPIPKEALP